MSGISDHLYQEMMKAMRQAPIKDAITRQAPIVQQWVEDSIEASGVDSTSEFIEDLISMNDVYEGSRPVFNQLVEFGIELHSNGIERGSAKFDAQVRGSADYGSMDTFYQSGNEIVPAPNPDRSPEHINEAEDMQPEQHPLRASWDSAVDRYKEAEASGDTSGMESAERMLDHLRTQIEAKPAPTPATPVPSPDVPDGLQRSNDIHDELQRRLDAIPDEYSEENQRELDAVTAAIDALDESIDEADEHYG